MLKRLLIGVVVGLSMTISACSTDVLPAAALNTVKLSNAFVKYQAELVRTEDVIDKYASEFSDVEWRAIMLVRADTKNVNLQILNILARANGDTNVVMDISLLLASIENLNTHYRSALYMIRPKVAQYSPSLQARLINFHKSLGHLSASYMALRRGGGDATEHIVRTLEIIATGSRLFGQS